LYFGRGYGQGVNAGSLWTNADLGIGGWPDPRAVVVTDGLAEWSPRPARAVIVVLLPTVIAALEPAALGAGSADRLTWPFQESALQAEQAN
jgi:hypothetical protein